MQDVLAAPRGAASLVEGGRERPRPKRNFELKSNPNRIFHDNSLPLRSQVIGQV